MAKTILEEAMEDAKLLKETAIENAKNVLVEAISPKIKEFVDAQLGEAGAGMMGMIPGLMPGMMPTEAGMYEKHADEDEDMALMKKLGVLGDEESDEEHEEEEDEDMDEHVGMASLAGIAGVAEAEDKKEDKEELQEADEVVEVSDADLKEALSEVLSGLKLKSEATVTKGFGAAQDATLKVSGGAGAKGIADEKAGEHHWKDEEPPAAQDWTVKEHAYKKKIASLVRENGEYKEACSFLKRNLQEVNLFNSKLLYTNKLLHSAKLNNEMRLNVIEAFDRASNLREVELVYKSLSESLKIAGVLGESKQVQKTLKGPKASRLTTPSSTVLQESREAQGSFTSRLQELAGLVD